MGQGNSLWNTITETANRFGARVSRRRGIFIRTLHLLIILAMLIPGVPAQRGRAAVEPDQSRFESQEILEPTPTPTWIVDIGELITATATVTGTLPTPTQPPPTAMPTVEEPTQTPLPTEPPVADPTETPNPYPEPGSSPTPTIVTPAPATPTPTSAPIETLVPTETITPSQEISLTLNAPESVLPGRVLFLEWMTDETSRARGDLDVEFKIPEGLEPIAEISAAFDPAANLLRLSPAEDDRGIPLVVPWDVGGPYTILASIVESGQAVYTRTITVREEGLNQIPANGGEAGGLFGKVNVTFPPDGAGRDLSVRVQPVNPDRKPLESLSGAPFEINAWDEKIGEEIHRFDEDLVIEVAYDGRNDARLAYYDEEKDAWERLPGEYDRENGVVRATVDHLSIFDLDVIDYQAARLPSVENFQVADFTGAATYSYPIWTPPGPGGHRPSLALTYNSQVVDAAYSPRTQASWVGMGWSLDAGYIERDFHGTYNAVNDDTFSVLAGGVSSLILKDSSGEYRLADENFWKVKYDDSADTWTLWDKEGAQYTFGVQLTGEDADSAKAQWPDHYGQCQITTRTWKWVLTESIDKYGNVLEYYYTKEGGDGYFQDECPQADYDRAIYLREIRYASNDGRYRILTELEGGREDNRSSWLASPTFFQYSRLKKIFVVNDPDGASGGSTGTNIRTYTFNYNELIFPGYVWPEGGQTFTLSSIQETGLNSATLPQTTFDYDGLHLVSADNGYGGSVEFEYEEEPWGEANANEEMRQGLVTTNQDFTGEESFDFADNFVRPGGAYRIVLGLRNNSGQSRLVTVEIKHGDGGGDVTELFSETLASNEYIVEEFEYVAPAGMSWEHLEVVIDSVSYRITQLTVKHTLSRYRVVERTLIDAITAAGGHTYSYAYDDATTNYSADGCDISGDLYGIECSENRGNAMTRLLGPLGSNNERSWQQTWYHQDDVYKGMAHTTIAGSQTTSDINEPFDTLNTSYWAFSDPGEGNYQFNERISGDSALRHLSLVTDPYWPKNFHRNAYSLSDDEVALVNFRTSGSATLETVLAAEYDVYPNSTYQRWGIYVQTDGSVDVQYIDGTTVNEYTLSGMTVSKDTWYTLLLLVDNQKLYLRLWERDDPGTFSHYFLNSPSGLPSNTEWRFRNWVNGNGSVYLDEYSEGKLYTFSTSEYDSTNYTIDSNFSDYEDLQIAWRYQTEQRSLSFEGKGSTASGRATYSFYETGSQGSAQYANMTHMVESEFDSFSLTSPFESYDDYRITWTRFYPYTDTDVHLVGLPGYTNVYKCASGANGACKTGFSGSNSDLLSSDLFVYDDNTAYDDSPDQGILRRSRSLLRFAGANDTDPRYQDTAYTFDAWGNPATVTAYSQESAYNNFGVGGGRTTTYCYGDDTPGTGGSCDADAYHTFLGWEENAEGHLTSYTYDYVCAQPVSEINPNDIETEATYDNFCRLNKVIKDGDSESLPTIQIVHNDDYYQDFGDPYMMDVHQRITSGQSATYSQRKFYNGLGQLIQVQTPGAELDIGTRDVVVDYAYDGYGQLIQETVPYAIAEWTNGDTPWRDQVLSTDSTDTVYDVLGRVLSVTATDGISLTQANEYFPLKRMSVNANGNATKSVLDGRGRVAQVIPLNGTNEGSPINPTVSYTYDDLDRLMQVTRAGHTTSMEYDYLGNKLELDDPDMGVWTYEYNALGELVKQTDAKHQVIEMEYDSLGRMTEKSPTMPTFVDTFDSKDTSAWTWNSYQTIPYNDGGNDVVRNQGTGSNWAASFWRSSYNLSDGDGLQVRFKVSDTDTRTHLAIEANDGTYRRFGAVMSSSGDLVAQYNNGSGYLSSVLIANIQTNTWYVVQIRIDDAGEFSVSAHKESDPNVHGEFSYDMASGQNWRFRHWIYRDVDYVDDYQEFTAPTVYQYDAYNPSLPQYGKGYRTGMIDASGATYWRYDARGRVWREEKYIAGAGTFETKWGYNSADQVAWMTYPGGQNKQTGEQVNFSYLPQMSLDSLVGTSNYVNYTEYDPAGRITTRRIGGVLTQSYEYFDWTDTNGWGRLEQMTTGSIQDLTYTYDANGNVLSIFDDDANQTQSFGYDKLDRLTSASASGGAQGNYSQTYSYSSSSGNLSQKAGSNLYYYDSSHPHAVTAYNGRTYTYDGNGNQTVRNMGEGEVYNLTYDLENRFVSAGSSHIGKYVYDGDGSRVKETTALRTIYYVGNYYEYSVDYDPSAAPLDAADTLSFRGTVTDNNDNEGLLGADLELRNKQTCPLSNGSLDAQATATEDFYQTAELKVYSYTGAYVTTITKTCARFCTVFDFPTTSMAPGSYQGYVRFSMFGGYGYSDVQAFAINGESTTTKSWTENTELSAPPSVGAVNPLPFTEEETTETVIASTSTNGDGEYRLNVASPGCDSGCDCTLHIDAKPPASFNPVSASAPSPGVVVSATEIRYPYQSSGERTQNDFTVHYNGDLYLGVRKYYYAGTQRVAVREDGVLNYLLTDHLGSTSITANNSGVKTAEMRYKAWGEVRYASGTTPTDYTFTGQHSEIAGTGLMFYKSRWYDPCIMQFQSPDTLIPDPYNPQDWNRYSYARNNPLKFTDPSGHRPIGDEEPPPEPSITIDEDRGLCIHAHNFGCSGRLESNLEWMKWNIGMIPYELGRRWYSEQWWSDVSVELTDLAFATSSVGGGVEATLTGLGATGGTFGAIVGAITGNEIHQVFINPLETLFSTGATASTIRADYLSGSSSLSPTGETLFVDIGENTATAVGSQVIGNISTIGVVDAIIDGYASSYSHGTAPGLLSTVGLSNKTIMFGPITIRFGQ